MESGKFIPALCILLVLMNTSIKAEDEDCSCGLTNPSRIVGGDETGVNEFPMMAGLLDVLEKVMLCGATIITEIHVLTSASCIEHMENNIRPYGVVVGEHDITTGADTSATRIYGIEKMQIHPYYNRETLENDVGIITPRGRFRFSMAVGPVCLPFSYTETDFTGQTVTALGWGLIAFGGARTNTLQKVDLNVISQEECAKDYNITSNMLCTFRRGKDTCQNDGGGPILWQNATSKHMMLIGVISGGTGCASDKPSINTRVTSYLNFIKEKIGGYTLCTKY